MIDDYVARLRELLPRRSRRLEREVFEHLVDRATQEQEAGASPEEAERRALAGFGPPELIARQFVETGGAMSQPHRWPALVGAVLVVPAVLFIVSSLLKYSFGSATLYDGFFASVFDVGPNALEIPVNLAIVLGPVIALGLAAWASIDLQLHKEHGAITGRMTFYVSAWNLVVALVSVAALVSMAAYLLAENLPCLVGGRVTC